MTNLQKIQQEKEKNPLDELFINDMASFKKGFRMGQDDMMDEMGKDFDLGFEKGFDLSKKYLLKVFHIANEWNTKKITYQTQGRIF